MREIKFRGKRVDNGGWVYGYYFKTPLTDEATGSKSEDGWFFLAGRERHCISKDNCVYEIIPESVGQYTGLKDKNGAEIYEGDIVAAEGQTAVVEFSKGMFCVAGDTSLHHVVSSYKAEVIGNIYDDKELLGGEEE